MKKRLSWKKKLTSATFGAGGLLAAILAFFGALGLGVNALAPYLYGITYDEARAKGRDMDVTPGRLPSDFLTSDNYINTNYMIGQGSQHPVEGYTDTPSFDVLYRSMAINSNGLKLAAQTSPEGTVGKKFVILLHAMGNARPAEYPYAWQWSMRDYYSVSYDAHGWGDSAKYGDPTFGYYESRDLSRIIGQVEKDYAPSQIVISGDSMGAGTVATYATTYLNNDKALYKNTNFMLITDSAYGSIQGEFNYIAEDKLHIPGWPILATAGTWMNILNKMHYQDVTPLVNYADFNTPIMIIQGSIDDTVPYTYGVDFFTKKINAGQPAMFLNIQGSNHVRSFSELGHDSTYNSTTAQGNILFKYIDHFLAKYQDGSYKGDDEIDVPMTADGITLVKSLDRGDVTYKNETWGCYFDENNKELYKANVIDPSNIKNWDPDQKHFN